MSETKETDHKTAGGRKTMSLNVKRTVEQGHIRQNFSHGRSKSVLVETKRKRSVSPGTATRSRSSRSLRLRSQSLAPSRSLLPIRQEISVLRKCSGSFRLARWMRAPALC